MKHYCLNCDETFDAADDEAFRKHALAGHILQGSPPDEADPEKQEAAQELTGLLRDATGGKS